MIRNIHFTITGAVLLVAAGAGCGTTGMNPHGVNVTEMRPDERGFVAGTGIESQDLVAVADKMARSILAITQIANAQGKPNIVLEPVVNETRFPINKEIFLTRIRVALNTKAGGKVTFLARDRMDALEKERDLKQTGKVTGGTPTAPVEFKGGDFILTGKLQSISTRSNNGSSDYVLYTFQLLDPRTSAIIWEDFAEIKKQGQSDAVYR